MAGGRPTVMTPEVIRKLEYAFSIGCTDEEATLYADISMTTLYKFQSENPEFADRKATLKQNPVLKARLVVYNEMEQGDKQTAQWYLERKKKDEFSPRVENTGKDGKDLFDLDAVYDRIKQTTKSGLPDEKA